MIPVEINGARFSSAQRIFVSWQTTLFHHWPEAPMDVDYLRYLHRHILHVTVTIEVLPEPKRELEFHRVLNYLKLKLEEFLVQCESVGATDISCELIARTLTNVAVATYGPDRYYKVSVSEDGENGAIYSVKPLEKTKPKD